METTNPTSTPSGAPLEGVPTPSSPAGKESPSKETVVTIATQCIKKAKAARAKKPRSAKARKKTDTAQPDDRPAWPGGVYITVVVSVPTCKVSVLITTYQCTIKIHVPGVYKFKLVMCNKI